MDLACGLVGTGFSALATDSVDLRLAPGSLDLSWLTQLEKGDVRYGRRVFGIPHPIGREVA